MNSSDSPEICNQADFEEFMNIAEMPEALPAVVGFTEKHQELNHELIRRVAALLTQPCTVTNYGIRKTYPAGVQESMQLELGKNIRINLEVITYEQSE